MLKPLKDRVVIQMVEQEEKTREFDTCKRKKLR